MENQGGPRTESEFQLDQSLGFVVNRTALNLATALTRALYPHDVTPQQWAVLARLWEEEGQPQQSIAEKTFRDPPGTARILDRLQRKGLVVRMPDPADRRAQLVYLTAQGRALQKIVVPIVCQVLERSVEGISQEDLAVVLRTLKHVDNNLA